MPHTPFQKYLLGFARISAVALMLSLSLPLSAFAANAHAQKSTQTKTQYIVQLVGADSAILQLLGSDVEPQFGFAKNANFANVYSFQSSLSLSELRLKLAGHVSYLEVDRDIAERATVRVSDPGFTTKDDDTDKQWGLAKAEFIGAWNRTTGDRSIVVGVIDTGIDATHEDLRKQKFVTGFDFIEDKEIKPNEDSDDNGHGTLVAGIVGATADNDKGIAGAAWQVSLMSLKALNGNGSGKSSNIAEAIVWAADHGVSIINMSLGGLGISHDNTLSNAISYAFNKNVILIAAAGNDVAVNGGNMNDNPVFPICADNNENMIIGVTATDTRDVKPSFANFGKACVDVAAPGRRILSTINIDPANHTAAPNAYAFASGTSMAVPFVSAQAVLLKAVFPTATNRQIRDRIIATTDSIDNLNKTQCGGLSCKGLLGSGRINVAASLKENISAYVQEGDVVELQSTKQQFYISGSKRHYITPFVRSQRFATVTPKPVKESDLALFPEDVYAAPLDGTLIKADNDGTVYRMSRGLKQPVTAGMFKLYGFSVNSVYTLNATEVHSWITGGLLAPPDGSLVRTAKSPALYWVVDGVLRLVSYDFYVSQGLKIFPVIYVSDSDMNSFPKGDSY